MPYFCFVQVATDEVELGAPPLGPPHRVPDEGLVESRVPAVPVAGTVPDVHVACTQEPQSLGRPEVTDQRPNSFHRIGECWILFGEYIP